MTRIRLIAVGAAAALVGVSACAPKEAAEAPPPAPNEVMVHATDFAFELPAQIPAGMTTFKLMNAGTTYHHMVLARLDSGKTFNDAMEALKAHGPPPAWLVLVGGPNAPQPNGESNATLDMQAGEYIAFCVVDIPGGVPHMAKGMVKPLTVTPATGAMAAAPTSHIKITMADYTFALSTPITAGTHTFEVVTAPGQPHELEIIRLADGKTLDDFMGEMGAIMSGKPGMTAPSAVAVGGVAPAVAGTTQYFTASFTPGNYVVMCFLPDSKDGKPHMEHGMVQPFTVN